MEISLDQGLHFLNILLIPGVVYIVKLDRRITKLESFIDFLKSSCSVSIIEKGGSHGTTEEG